MGSISSFCTFSLYSNVHFPYKNRFLHHLWSEIQALFLRAADLDQLQYVDVINDTNVFFSRTRKKYKE